LEEYRLENDTKLLNLDNKKNDLEYKRRLYPSADHSHEELTIAKLEKYLVRTKVLVFNLILMESC